MGGGGKKPYSVSYCGCEKICESVFRGRPEEGKKRNSHTHAKMARKYKFEDSTCSFLSIAEFFFGLGS